MNNIVTQKEIESFKKDGAIFLKNRFNIEWIKYSFLYELMQ